MINSNVFHKKENIENVNLPVKYKKIQYDLEKILSYAKGYQNIDIDCSDVMNTWYKNKKEFIHLFNGNLIYEFSDLIEIQLTEQEKKDLINKCIIEFEDRFNNNNLVHFLECNKEGFFNNLVVNDDFSIKRLKKGDKLLKSFKYFTEDNSELRDAQDLASRYIQKAKVKGKLCLSVHPFDFMTISDNNSNWASCHSIDGEYSMGNMNYMLDSSTFVVYLKSEADEQLKCFPEGLLWNNKKWRVLAHMTDTRNGIWFNKQYPFKCNALIEEIHRNCESPFNKEYDKPVSVGIEKITLADGFQTIAYRQHLIYYEDIIYDLRDIIKNGEDTVHYNDLISNSQGCPAILMSKQWIYVNKMIDDMFTIDSKLLYRTTVGKSFKPICGHDLPFDEDMEHFVCKECAEIAIGNVTKCECCGRVVYPLENELSLYQEFENELLWVCPECKKELDKLKESN